MSLRYGLIVKDFACPECGEFSDEISQYTADIMDDFISTPCCDETLWRYDLEMEGYEVIEDIQVISDKV